MLILLDIDGVLLPFGDVWDEDAFDSDVLEERMRERIDELSMLGTVVWATARDKVPDWGLPQWEKINLNFSSSDHDWKREAIVAWLDGCQAVWFDDETVTIVERNLQSIQTIPSIGLTDEHIAWVRSQVAANK